MPTTQVYTWEQFTTAYTTAQGTSSDPHVIEIMADLDAASSISASYNAGANYYKQINGNYHNISNIATQTTFNGVIFNGNHVTWNKCNFINVIRNNNYPIFYGSGTYIPTFNDCTFQGKGIGICGPGDLTGNTGNGIYIRCVITWDQVGNARTGSLFGGANFEYCYLDINIITSTRDSYEVGTINSSFIKGNIKGSIGSRTHSMCNICNNTVINISSDNTYPKIANTADTLSVYNRDKMSDPSNVVTNIVGVTDAQLKDAAYLASINFNIIVYRRGS